MTGFDSDNFVQKLATMSLYQLRELQLQVTMDKNNIEDKIFKACVKIENCIRKLRGTADPNFDQIKRSSTSIGANYAEALRCVTERDYRNKVNLSQKECSETIFWIKILHANYPEEINDEVYEEFKADFETILNNLDELYIYSLENDDVPTEWGKRIKGKS